MDIFTIRQKLRTMRLSDIPLRVTFYARVSTDTDEQLNSLDNQIGYYRDYITRNPAWTFIDGYIDEGLSGMTTRKRDNFQRMVQDAKDDKFDLILTKEITRFARNTLDSIRYTRELLSAGVGVFFQNDNINTFDEDSELRLTIMSGIAQDELRKLSSRVRFGHQQAIKNNVVLGNSRIFGYRKDSRRLVIDENEAPMVRELFELYATDHYSMKQIENLFWEKGYRNHNGKKIAHTTMSGMIANPKYKGYFVGGKVKVVDIFNKRQKFLPEEKWVMYKDESGETIPPLVSEELWQKANEVFQRRSIDVKGRRNCSTHKNVYTGKLFCTEDGAPYYCKDVHYKGTSVSKWVCSHKINHGAASCRSVALYESELNPIILDAFREFSQSADTILDAYLQQYRQVMADSAHYISERGRISSEILAVEKRQDELLDMKLSGLLTTDEFKRMMDKTRAQKAELEDALEDLSNWEEISEHLEGQMERLKKTLAFGVGKLEDGLITRDFVDNFIQRIDVTPLDDGHIKLDIQLLTDKVIHREFEKIKGRTGQTSKKMIQSYEQGMSNE